MTDAPVGYTHFSVSGADVVALGACADAVRAALDGGSLYAYAASHPGRRAMRGRGAAFAVALPDDGPRVVVRHSRHGGLLAPVTGDRFLAPTRAPHELRTALRLADAGVPTPQVVAYATYPAGPLLRRSDVVTREVAGGVDLAALLAAGDESAAHDAALTAAATLLRALEQAGARHPDLNAANVLIVHDSDGATQALVLDVDRVVFERPHDRSVGAANLARLTRSLRKLRSLGSIRVSDAAIARLGAMAGHGT